MMKTMKTATVTNKRTVVATCRSPRTVRDREKLVFKSLFTVSSTGFKFL